MASSKPFNLELLKCACGDGSKVIKHYLKNPITLQCGHVMCRECIDAETRIKKTFKCGICNKDNKIDKMSTLTESVIISELIDCHLNEFTTSSHNLFKHVLNDANGKSNLLLFTHFISLFNK